ncbi:transmembrane protein, putative (macronuclear) [Tetrahymena thermophila SB210]|uniref:Transmembrane protein, putative n=1 Tax=Tetrahymena thermophila (strain SB210) TaxID=312017 RepID=I7LWU6_TETTS|nr:transmembrane protein, putative [Tetrahymena thermophila SB210]EAS02888.3 transmembrane protein, putative [Tetrahymena thermophila SB210]|eukprot:XP_001023133.3 transmembrane protein, putative [Tetrahymena thermophila SB210]
MKQIICTAILAFTCFQLIEAQCPQANPAPNDDSCCLNNNPQKLDSIYISKLADGSCSQSDSGPNIIRCYTQTYCLLSSTNNKCINLMTSTQYTGFNTDDSTCIDNSIKKDQSKIQCSYKNNPNSPTCLLVDASQGSCYFLDIKSSANQYRLNNGFCGGNTSSPDIALCSPGYVCLDSTDSMNKKCLEFQKVRWSSSPYINSIMGTSSVDGTCIISASAQNPSQTTLAIVCAYDFCLTPQGQCVQLNTIRYIGREQNTSNCIEIGTNGKTADSCSKGYCLFQSNCYQITITNQLNLKLDPTSSNPNEDVLVIGSGLQGDDFNRCIFQKIDLNKLSNPQNNIQTPGYFGAIYPDIYAEQCDYNNYCLQCDLFPVKCKCKLIGDNMCKDANNQCTSNDNSSCVSCRYDQCIQNTGKCQTLNSSPTPYCQANQSKCNSVQDPTCISCPAGYCFDSTQTSAKCIEMSSVQIQNNQCLINRYGFVACQYLDMNARKQQQPEQNLFCADNNNACQLIYTDSDPKKPNSSCLRCPDSYKNPGNKICYKDNTSSTSTGGSTGNIFGLNLKEEIKYYDINSNYLYTSNKNNNCFYEDAHGTCLQCIQNYFLRQINGQIKCIQCPTTTTIGTDMIQQDVINYYDKIYLSDYQSLFQYQKPTTTSSSVQCYDCIMNIQEWAPSQHSQYLNCQQFIFSYQQLAQTTIAMSYLKSFNIDSTQQLQVFQPDSSQQIKIKNCKTIKVKSDGTPICQVCDNTFTFDYKNEQCFQCNPNCLNCYYGGLYEGQMVNWSSPPDNLKNIDFKSLSGNQYQLLCSACLKSVGYTLMKDFTDCEQCATKCDYCYWGNTSFNLTSKNTIYSADYLKDLDLKKKCVQCSPGFVFDKTFSQSQSSIEGQACVAQLYNCQQSAFLNKTGFPLTINPWFNETQVDQSKGLQCLLCQYKSGSQIQLQNNQCQPLSSSSTPLSCQVLNSNNQCQLCNTQSYLKLSNNQCTDGQCSTLVYDCQRCYQYQDSSTSASGSSNPVDIYQCLECSTPGKVPSINGCVDCPIGCSSCYEGNSQLNFTAQLLYIRPQLTLQQRLFYQSQFDTKFICTSCQNGYVLDVVEQTCVYKDCGPNCAKCDYTGPIPQCQVCNITNLIQPIQNLIGNIGQFYFQSSNFDYSLFASFTSDKTDCQLCPIWCTSCDPITIGSDPFNLYNSQCHGCKSDDKVLQSVKLVDPTKESVTMTFDRSRGRCYFCKNIQTTNNPSNGCHYYQDIKIDLFCGSISEPIQQGTSYNLARGNEINWDSVILGMSDLNSAYVQYNELSVREIIVTFNILAKDPASLNICTLNSKITISSQIANEIKSLQVYKLIIQGDLTNNPPPNQILLKLNGLLIFEGFQQIQMQNFNVQATNEDSVKQYGLSFSSTNISMALFQNMSFTRTKLGTISSALNIIFNNLYQKLNFTNVDFDYIYMVKQNLIQTTYDIQQTINGAINIQLNKVTFNNAYLDSCNFLSIQVAQTNINMIDVNLISSELHNGAQLLQYNMASSTSTVGIIMQNFIMQNVTITSSSYIFQMSQLSSWYANKIKITGSTFQDTSYNAAVFVANGANINNLQISNTVFTNYCFLMTPSVISSNNLYNSANLFMIYNVIFNQNKINVPGTILINLQGYSVSQYNIELKSFNIASNTFSLEPDGQNLISINTFNTVELNHIFVQDYQNTDSLIVNSVQQTTFNDINCFGTTYDKYVNSCIQLTDFHSTAIFKSITLSNFKSQSSQISIQMQIDVSSAQNTGVQFNNITMSKVFLYQDLAFENLAGLYYYSTSSVSIYMSQINITNNTLDAQGKKIYGESSSGIFIDSFLSSVTLANSTFSQNTALQSKNSLSILSMNVSVYNVIFSDGNKYISDNDILNEIQGGLFYVKSSYLIVKECTFQNSKAQSGALYWQALGNATAGILDSIFQNNTASFSSLKSQGGAFYIETQFTDQITLDIKNNQFINNYAIYDGAAIFIQNFKKKAYIKMVFNTFIDNFSSNGACLDALLHENSMSEIDISMNHFSFQPQNSITISYINSQLEASDRLQNGFIALQGFNRTRLEQNEFYIDVFPRDYDFVLSSQDIQQVVFQSWILLMKSQYLLDLASKFTSSTIGQPLIVTQQLTQIQLINTVIQNLNSFYDKFALISQGKQLMTSSSLIRISALGAEFIGLQSQNLVCTQCNLGNIYVESSILNIRSSLFQQSQANQGAGLYLAKILGSTNYQSISQNIKSSNFYDVSRLLKTGNDKNSKRQLDSPPIDPNTGQRKIEQCQFLYNKATNGGAIFIDTAQIDIINTEFLQNSASKFGGAIYYNLQPNQPVNQNQFLVYSSQFVRNSANVGGAIYSNGNIIKTDDKTPENQNTYIQNIGKQFGSDKIQNPTGFQILSNNTIHKGNFTLKLHNSGPIQDEILVQFINEAGEVYSQVDPTSQIQLNLQLIQSQQQQSMGIVNPNSLQFTNNFFNLTSAVSVIGKFEQNLQIQLSSPYILIPSYDKTTGNVTEYSSSYIFYLNVNIRSCLAGEEQQVIEEKFDTCVPCISPTYNLQPNDQCKKCPLADAVCEGKTILLPPGYWRFNSSSDEILECINLVENCVGDINRTDPSGIVRSYQNQYCFEGHVGLRCEDCDILGKEWNKSYSKAGKFKCSDCTQVSGNILKLIAIQFGTIILTGFFVKSTIDLIQKKILQKIIPTSRKQQQQGESGIYIKIFMNYIQIIQTLFTFNLKIPDAFSSIFQYSASPVENSMMAQDCFLVQIIGTFMNKENMLYFRIIIGQMQVILTFFLFYICFLALAQIMRWKTSSAVIFCALNYIFISNQPGIFNMIVGSFSCTSTQTASFVKDYVQYQCDSTHSLWKYSLMLPLILLWALFIPAGQYYVLRRASKTPKDGLFQRRYNNNENQPLIKPDKPIVDRSSVIQKETMLDSSKIRYALGFIYLEYRKDTYYWEMIKIFEKMLIIFVLNMYDSEIKLKGILCFIIIFGYGLISLKYRPYQREQLNSVDFWSSNICALSLVLGVMLSSADSNQIIQYLGYGFIILINLIFVLWIVKIILSAYLEEFDEIVNKAKIFLCKMYPSLKPILKPKEFDPKKIKLIWDSLKHAINEYSRAKKIQVQQLNLKTSPNFQDELETPNQLMMNVVINRVPDDFRRIVSAQPIYPAQQVFRTENHNPLEEEEEIKDQYEGLPQNNSPDQSNLDGMNERRNKQKTITRLSELYVNSSKMIHTAQNYEDMYYQELKAAFKDVEFKNWLRIKDREIRIDYDQQSDFQNIEALKNNIKKKKKKLTEQLKNYIHQYSNKEDIVDYFKSLQKDIDDKSKFIVNPSMLKDVDAYFTYYGKMIELQVKMINLEDITKNLYILEHQNNRSDIFEFFKELIKEKVKFEKAEQDRNDFELYMELYERYLELKSKAENILSRKGNDKFTNELTKTKNTFLSKYSNTYNRESAKKEKESYRKQLEKQKQEMQSYLESSPLHSRPPSDGSGFGSNGSLQSPLSGEINVELQKF